MAYYLYNKVIPEYNEKYVYYDPDEKSGFLNIIGAGIVYPDKHYGYKKTRDCHTRIHRKRRGTPRERGKGLRRESG